MYTHLQGSPLPDISRRHLSCPNPKDAKAEKNCATTTAASNAPAVIAATTSATRSITPSKAGWGSASDPYARRSSEDQSVSRAASPTPQKNENEHRECKARDARRRDW